MRKRIYRISEDKFDDLKPNIEFSQEIIEALAYAGEAFEGSFSIKSTNGVPIRGIAYCSNPYVKLVEPQFEGELINVAFTVDNINAKVGEVLEGSFTLIAVGVEKNIPFSIKYEKKPLMTAFGELKTLEDFALKAQGRFPEAVNIFYSEAFEEFISSYDKKTRLLYRGFRGASLSPVNVDEFLVACGLKETMTFSVEERTDSYYEVSENVRGEVEILRNTWGYIDIEVSCDADFVSVEKDHITADFFLGSVFNMNYYIHKDKMHDGLNYARISFDYRDNHKEIIIMATAKREDGLELSEAHERKLNKLKLCRSYEDFRLRKISTGKWCKDTLELLELVSPDLSDNMLLLYKALIYITNKQRQEALWIIQDLKRTIENKSSLEWAFLLYLCTLIEREESYVDRLTADIEYIYKEHSDDVRIFWFLLQLRKEYVKNPTAKLRAIAAAVEANGDSPALFVEAYFVFIQDPYLLNCFDKFNIKVLSWAMKHKAITRDIAIQMIHVLDSQRVYVKKSVPILETCYEIYPDNILLKAMVSYMLKAERVEEDFLKWFRLAIEKNLHVPGIFEAYLMALNDQSVEKLPQLLTMFFRYHNELPYEKKALLYANIILHKDEDPDIYSQYERNIEMFAIEQLKQGHLDDNLAICYQLLLDVGLIDAEIARLLTAFAFRKKVAVIYPNIKRVVLYQEEFKGPTTAPVKDHQAYLMYMGHQGVVFLEDERGHLIANENGYLVEEILNTEGRMSKLKELCPQSLAFILDELSGKERASDFTKEDMEGVELFLTSPQILDSYRISMYPKIIEYLRFNNREELLEKYFMKDADLKALTAETVADVIEVLVTRSKYEEAYYMLSHTNGSLLKKDVAKKLCQFMINKVSNKPEDFLISLTADLVSREVIHSDMLYYLVQNYVGPTELMMKIYFAGFESGIDMAPFAERILTQAVYRGFMPENIIEVFDSYMVRKTNRMVVEAFLTLEAYDYLSNGTEVPENIFAYIFNRYKKGLKVNESMRIALLKFLCLEDELDEEETNLLDALLADSIIRNQYFSFFSKCDKRLRVKYHLYDKHFVEFRGARHKAVRMRYSINGGEMVEDEMIEMYDGLFLKEFVLFFGDELKYEVYCPDLSEEPLESGEFINSDEIDDNIKARYGLMNNMSRYMIYKEKDKLAEAMKQYQGLETVTNQLFTVI